MAAADSAHITASGGAPRPVHVRATQLCKRYANGIQANEGVSLAVARGEIHAIVGENGAGKSTLLKMLYGWERPDSGAIEVDGQPRAFNTPTDAIAAGMGLVPQHLELVPSMTCAENIVLGSEPCRAGFLDRARAQAEVAQLASLHGMPVVPDAPVASLSAGARQRVAILKALRRGARLLMLDEPTALLSAPETQTLFASLQQLAAQGLSILLITHKLAEVRALCESFTALRAGRVAGHGRVNAFSDAAIAELIVGAQLRALAPARVDAAGRAPAVRVRELSLVRVNGRPELDAVSFDIAAGEILGIAGVEGNGQDRLAEVLAGLRPASVGSAHVHGQPILGRGVSAARAQGVGLIPEDRLHGGLAPHLSVAENASALTYRTRAASRHGVIHQARRDEQGRALIRQWGIRARDEQQPVAGLSGGNMQKLLVGRELAARPRLLIASQPTRGVDMAAAQELRRGILALRDAGAAILLLTADLDELLELSDRIAVLFEGRLVAHLKASEANAQLIGRCMTGLHGKGAVDAVLSA